MLNASCCCFSRTRQLEDCTPTGVDVLVVLAQVQAEACDKVSLEASGFVGVGSQGVDPEFFGVTRLGEGASLVVALFCHENVGESSRQLTEHLICDMEDLL